MAAHHDVLALAVQAGIAVLIDGAPGIGKTQHIYALGRALNRNVVVVIPAIRPPEDFGGFPSPDLAAGVVRLLPVGRIKQQLTEHPDSIVFLDEIRWAPPAVQAALLRWPIERVMGEWEMPAECTFVAAANPAEQAGGGYDLTPPLANRFLHIRWPLDARTWSLGMATGWPAPSIPALPERWRTEYLGQARACVLGYIAHQPHKLLVEPTTPEDGGRAWPSPRTWEYAITMLAACRAAHVSEDTQQLAIASAVGPVASEFVAWLRDADLPDPEAALASPETFVLPKRSDQQYVALLSIAAAVTSTPTQPRYAAGWTITANVATVARDMAAIAGQLLAEVGLAHPELREPKDAYASLLPLIEALEAARRA